MIINCKQWAYCKQSQRNRDIDIRLIFCIIYTNYTFQTLQSDGCRTLPSWTSFFCFSKQKPVLMRIEWHKGNISDRQESLSADRYANWRNRFEQWSKLMLASMNMIDCVACNGRTCLIWSSYCIERRVRRLCCSRFVFGVQFISSRTISYQGLLFEMISDCRRLNSVHGVRVAIARNFFPLCCGRSIISLIKNYLAKKTYLIAQLITRIDWSTSEQLAQW